ncbi:WUSCHEL-related homeobox 9 [Magnolia sinica]|uniref:WUSCHEL-related homeobox 9 n=1 Tax=Magnolia sinica TaxID=86752 RepID=UPI0026580986|nr:WUSCHEL-related homeobox 9 [Magnolia sinica]
MASSNRHWPSMFKSKPCNTHHQWQHEINSSLMSNACQKTSYTSAQGCEERSPEPKPRWNPKPEQIRILEAIFNSGMVNPPREEIRKIRAQLQEYGQVGDANVFYWFQNRKSRSKHKQRHLHTAKTQPQTTAAPAATVGPTITSSSTSSEKSSTTTAEKSLPLGGGGGPSFVDVVNSPTLSVNQTYFHAHGDFAPEPFLFHVQAGGGSLPHGCCFSELSNIIQMPEQSIGPCSALLSELMNQDPSKKEEKMKMEQQHHQHQSFVSATTTTITEIQGAGESGTVAPSGAARSTVFINDVAFEVGVGPLNVREAFGEDAVLLHSSGQPVLTNEWGVTLHALQHGAFYYLV